jgi:hypothetical protein
MLGPLVLNGVSGEVDRTDVVVVDERAPEKRAMDLQGATGVRRP